jgi:membrane protein
MPLFQKIETLFLRIPPVKFILQKSKQTSFPGFSGIPIYDVVKFFFGQVRTIGMTERASAISYNFFMAIPPSLIFLFTLIPLMPISRQFEESLYSLIRDVIPGEKNNAYLIKFLKDFIRRPRTGLLSLGFILSLFFSSNAVMGIMRSFDKNYIGFRKRKEHQKRGAALKITLVMFVLFFISILLLVAQGQVLTWIGIKSATVRVIITNTRWVVIVLLFFTSIAYIYRHAPAVHKKWKFFTPGSLLATFLMLLFTFAFTYYVNHFSNYNQLYGSIGTVLILLLLIFFNSLVLLIGFELNVSISTLKKIADERKESETGGEGIMA